MPSYGVAKARPTRTSPFSFSIAAQIDDKNGMREKGDRITIDKKRWKETESTIDKTKLTSVLFMFPSQSTTQAIRLISLIVIHVDAKTFYELKLICFTRNLDC